MFLFVIRPHRSSSQTRPPIATDGIAWSVGLSVCLSVTSVSPPTGHDELIEMTFATRARVGLVQRPKTTVRHSGNVTWSIAPVTATDGLSNVWQRQLKAKFHYAILVADRFEAGRRPAASWSLSYHLARCRAATSFEPLCDQIAYI